MGPRLGWGGVRRSCSFLGTLPLALGLGPATSLPPARGDFSCWPPEPRLLRKADQSLPTQAGARQSGPPSRLLGGGGDTLYLGGVLWEALVADEAQARTSVGP